MKTETQIARERSRLSFVVLIACAILALVAAFLVDQSLARWLASHASKTLRHNMTVVSRVGDWPAHVALGLLLATIAWWRGNKRWRRIFLTMLLACALAGMAARVIKVAAGRARPSVLTENSWNGPRFAPKYQSFPSGHTASSTAFFVVLLLASRRLGVPLLAIPAVIALSRMIVGAHYLSDVIFAGILGVACALVAWRALLQTAHRESAIAN